MGARMVVYTLLSGDATVAGLVSTRIYPTVLPQDKTLPALVYQRISGVEPGQIDAQGSALVQTRIQITALADAFGACAALLDAAREAVLYQYGSIGGIEVVSIIRDIDGADDFDPDLQAYAQSIDVIVTHIETQ